MLLVSAGTLNFNLMCFLIGLWILTLKSSYFPVCQHLVYIQSVVFRLQLLGVGFYKDSHRARWGFLFRAPCEQWGSLLAAAQDYCLWPSSCGPWELQEDSTDMATKQFKGELPWLGRIWPDNVKKNKFSSACHIPW